MIAARERTHFWHVPRRRLLLDTIARHQRSQGTRLLDVGCGTGALVESLAQEGFDACGLDPWADKNRLDQARFKTGQAESVPWPDDSFGTVCAFDVLEHADDQRALQELFRVLKPGGLLFISVPAYDWLWSARDELAGHRRRYSRSMLRQRVIGEGFLVESLFGYQFLLLPMFAISRLWARLVRSKETTDEDEPGRLVNFLLRAVNTIEITAGRLLRPPVGSSLLLVGRKPLDGG